MRYRVLATDYDGTLAQHGAVAPEAQRALERLRSSGVELVLVTGRQLENLQPAFPALTLFSRVVAENGAVLHAPASGEIRLLAPPPPDRLVTALRARDVRPLSLGRAIVATDEPNRATVLEVLEILGLRYDIEGNKGAVMLLPAGTHKGSGLGAALEELGVSEDDVVGVGDAENDLRFLARCGFSVAVADALASVKSAVDLVTRGANGEGVRELVEALLEGRLASSGPRCS